ncbi:MAG: hypothetical protein PHN18_02885 [Sulfurospirillaceae bacterium]|jgi:sarcosine oxidase delta subunit|nr:hypothetical protein [Sulfurospirillaceae bacterium]MDD2827841.1 hypothetical protein [Sulfurospirillaceae bacterium]
MIIGKCPYCDGNVISQKINVQGQNVIVYACEHARKEYDLTESYVFSAESTCRFRIYSNALKRWNKRSIGHYEIKSLLEEGQIKVRLHGRKGTREYFKYAITDEEYGISILWDEEVSL